MTRCFPAYSIKSEAGILMQTHQKYLFHPSSASSRGTSSFCFLDNIHWRSCWYPVSAWEAVLLQGNSFRQKIPFRFQLVQRCFRRLFWYRRYTGSGPPWRPGGVLRLHILLSYVSDEWRTTELPCTNKCCLSLPGPCQAIHTGNQDVLHATVLQII